ncbi:ferritin-like domain-containing protein [Sorangium sp. So ce1335]|uniref:ferritin-like domain-containing protein n=1 Tax=Sorangium sp. So ce1335 TaxID=3133335 RepID=UPI003F603FEE
MADGSAAGARGAAAGVWRSRAHAELEAAARFSRLAEQLETAGAVAPVVAMARAAAADERRHAELCAALARELGGAAFTPRAVAGAAEVAPRGLDRRERVLYEVVAMACVTETLSAALLGEMVERATDPRVRETMQHILRDEVDHARLGWAHLAAERQRGCADVIGEHLPAMLAGTVHEEVFSSWTEHPAQEALSGLGALDRAERRRIFDETMRRVVLPGLRHLGIDTGRGEQWLAARLG